jgi:hypothetical protein
MGDIKPFDNRNFKTPNFLSSINFSQAETVDIFFRIESTSRMNVPITLHTIDHFYTEKNKLNIYFGVFFGVMLLLIIYGAINYIPTKNSSYLYFSLHTLSFTLLLASINGYTFNFLWPNLPILNQYAPITFVFLTTIFSIQLTKSFLNLKQQSPTKNQLLSFFLTINALIYYRFLTAIKKPRPRNDRSYSNAAINNGRELPKNKKRAHTFTIIFYVLACYAARANSLFHTKH